MEIILFFLIPPAVRARKGLQILNPPLSVHPFSFNLPADWFLKE